MVSYKRKHTLICDISVSLIDIEIQVVGWIRTLRLQASRGFLEIFDGSTSKTIQGMTEDVSMIESLKVLSVGSSISLSGIVVRHPEKVDIVELQIKAILRMGVIEDQLTYPLNARPSLEYLRDHQDVRVKTRTINANFRIRGGLSKATHDFFQKQKATHINPNIITTSDCEGGGEVFTLTTMLNKKTSSIPILEKTDLIDYSKDFFQKQAFLTVSSQLQLEALCAGLGAVWTSNKSFRSEKSKTSRHLAEFEHIEWEFPEMSLEDLMDLSEEYTQYCFKYILENYMDDLEVLDKFVSKGVIEKLQSFVSKTYLRISYDEAINLITTNSTEIRKATKLSELPKWGDDLGSECERYLSEVHFKSPMFVFNYPKDLKSFYMKQNDDQKTVQACDLLIPELGELIGSSVREDNYEKLIKTMRERKMDEKTLKWYIDLRRNGSMPTAGAGLGFDRLVRICTGMDNIRDVVAFPVAYQESRF
jgi:asparaginyl-tRNA synthetase